MDLIINSLSNVSYYFDEVERFLAPLLWRSCSGGPRKGIIKTFSVLISDYDELNVVS